MNDLLKIGELSKVSGVSIDTIRFYENKGLIIPTNRSKKGYRYYDSNTSRMLQFIISSKELGFTLNEIKELINIKVNKNGKCSLALDRIKEKELDIDKKILELKKIKDALNKVSKKCGSSIDGSKCHFLELLG
ncbi:MerR family transcriptional regulator [Halobacteriovorax sp.]|uniref:MerR family transcriptional regulator n=1 Tax=Halobacteriovorax sp. TaxID=2020862 RepID=UPI003AF305B1